MVKRTYWTVTKIQRTTLSTRESIASGSFGTLAWGIPTKARWRRQAGYHRYAEDSADSENVMWRMYEGQADGYTWSLMTTTRPLELVHTDVMGPMKTKSKGGARNVLVFMDDYSRYIVTYFLNKKKPMGGVHTCLCSDNGTEFVNKSLDKICQQYGIIHQNTAPYSPQQNGVAERMNRTIMEKARSMLHYSDVVGGGGKHGSVLDQPINEQHAFDDDSVQVVVQD
ncbi:Rve-domain-containing hypothetical protein [Phytophthora megakarya]|uniref:Integrase catalytic domain-containing protein n=1 Tax=Phytophthora megakarya TaxID=4795 RepID=A0A225WSC3_9STRA|nr:Rve-domain-containing hypothetical protein [Phytophthora megakarya]